MATKVCSRCKADKDTCEFNAKSGRPGKFQSFCKCCSKEYRRKYRAENADKIRDGKARWYTENKEAALLSCKRYYEDNKADWRYKCWASKLKREFGICDQQYNVMLAEQGGVCAICKQPETIFDNGIRRRLAVDHNHTTKQNRKLLCQRCNTVIGRCKENVSLLSSMIDYLIEHNMELMESTRGD